MTAEDAQKCLSLLSDKFKVYFSISYKAVVTWSTNVFPDMSRLDRKYGAWSMRIFDAPGFDGEDMPPADNKFSGNKYSGWYAKNGNPELFGFHVKFRDGNVAAKFVSWLSGRTFASSKRSVIVPPFSSYEELKLKLEVVS